MQRYGADISGGAELHARYLAEHLSSHAEVRVLTTCARDYITWRNELPEGEAHVNGIPVERFPVARERNADLIDFGRRSTRIFTEMHSLDDELQWLDVQGPVSPALVERIAHSEDEFDFLLAFSVRYHPAYRTARACAERVVLVPTAERESAMGLAMFPPIFRGARALMYNSPEERAMIQALAGNEHVPGVVVGVGSDIPDAPQADRARRKFGLDRPFLLYIGRIDVNKGCQELFDLFIDWQRVRYLTLREQEVDLVLIGSTAIEIPDHPRIRHLGFVTDTDKFDVLAAASLLVMPSYYESLSMVVIEAWALGKPVLVNARCDVLVGQCLRSNAGLYYRTAGEFSGAVDALLESPDLAATLGARGRQYHAGEYSWPVVEGKYLDMFERLVDEPPAHRMEPVPGFLDRRRRDKPPANDVLASLPSGPVRPLAPAEECSP